MPAPALWLDTFTVNAATAGAQADPVVVQLANGNILVAYRTEGGAPGDPAGSNILGSIFRPDGSAVVHDMLLNSAFTANNEGQPSIIGTPDGGFAVTYVSRGFNGSTSIGVDRYDGDLNPVGSLIVTADAEGGHPYYSSPQLAINDEGDAVIAYVATDANGVGGIESAAYYWTDGTMGQVTRSNTGPHVSELDLTSRLDGNFSIAYTFEGANDAGDSRINTNMLNAQGQVQFAPGPVPDSVNNGYADSQPSVTALTSDARVVVYTDSAGVIQIQRFVNGGTPTQNISLGVDLGGVASHPDTATLTDGNFVVAFEVDGGANPGIYVALYSPFLQLQGITKVTDGAVNETPTVAALADGRFVVSWHDADDNISMQILGGNGAVSAPVLGGVYTYQVGTPGDDVFTADNSSFYVYGGPGADTITETYGASTFGGEGNDTLIVTSTVDYGGSAESHDGGSGVDTIDWSGVDQAGLTFDMGSGYVYGEYPLQNVMTNFERLIGTAHNDIIYGTDGANALNGGGGYDVIFGGAGADLIDGGDGIDIATYEYGTTVSINLVTGVHTGDAAGDTFTSIEIFRLSEADDSFIGSGTAEIIYGLGGNDRLDGRGGSDALVGGLGNDRYVVDDAADEVSEAADEGNDTVEAYVNYTLTVNVENLVMKGTALNGTGNDVANAIIGNGLSNVIDGGAGADTMTGGKGDDVYYVDNAGDKIIELLGEGGDQVYSSVSYTLAGQYLEALTLTGSAAINGTGNSLANRIVGNDAVNILNGGDGNDRLDGGGGADKLAGGAGNDTYVVDNAADQITEANSADLDTVEASISYSLAGQYLETLKLMGSGNLNGTGNGLANSIYGNAGNNTLNGGGGADSLYGGAGNDIYVVDNAADKVFENANEGTDTVQSSVTFSINGQYVEALTLTGAAAINGTGNSLANVMTGNGAANALNGGAGDDALHGGLGSDTLTGGTGLDNFWFETTLGAGNVDTITDFKAVDDTITLDRTIFSGIAATGALDAAAFYQGTAAHDADDRIIYDKASGSLYYDADGNGAGAAVLFAKLVANTAVTVADFSVVA